MFGEKSKKFFFRIAEEYLTWVPFKVRCNTMFANVLGACK